MVVGGPYMPWTLWKMREESAVVEAWTGRRNVRRRRLGEPIKVTESHNTQPPKLERFGLYLHSACGWPTVEVEEEKEQK